MFDLNALPDDFDVFYEGVKLAGICGDLPQCKVVRTPHHTILIGVRIPRELYARAVNKYGDHRLEINHIRFMP